MKLSAPIPVLKRRAKTQARQTGITHIAALDLIARQEGFTSWSLLAARFSSRLYDQLTPGDLVLLGARPGQGKTLMGLSVLIDAIDHGRQGYFFTLEYTTGQVLDRLKHIGTNPAKIGQDFVLDTSDLINATLVIAQTIEAAEGAVIVVDYLQLLDQRRENPSLAVQVAALRAHAQARGLIIVLISQIDRRYDASTRPTPNTSDVRLPNPLDMRLFTKTCFLHDGEVVIS